MAAVYGVVNQVAQVHEETITLCQGLTGVYAAQVLSCSICSVHSAGCLPLISWAVCWLVSLLPCHMCMASRAVLASLVMFA